MDDYRNNKDRLLAFFISIGLFCLLLLFLWRFMIVTPTPPYPPSIITEVAIDFEGGGGEEGAQGSGNPEMTNPTKAKTNDVEEPDEPILTSTVEEKTVDIKKPKKTPKKPVKPKKHPKEAHEAKAEVKAPQASKELQDLSSIFGAIIKNGPPNDASGDGSGKSGSGNGAGGSGGGIGTGEGTGVGPGKGNGYALKGRKLLKRPELLDNSQEEGTVVVQIIVDENGKVIDAIPGVRGTTTNSAYLRALARQAAKTARFSPSPTGIKEQKGTYTFVFRLN